MPSLVAHIHGTAALHDDSADDLGHGHDLVDTDSPLITVRALTAADGFKDTNTGIDIGLVETLFAQGFGRDVDGLLAVTAEFACQALRDDQTHRGRDRIGLDAHVDETRERLWRIVRVQCGQHKVPGLRGFDRDFRSLQVANFADHDDVRVLAQKRAQCRSKSQSDLGVDVDLVDTWEIDFGRIFGRRDIAVFGVQNIETRIQRYGLAATRGTSHQDHALGFGEVAQIGFPLHRFVAERIDAQHGAGRIEDTRDDLFAEQRRAGADAEVDRAGFRQAHLDASVLGDASLCDVESRHDLEARDDLDGQLHRR